MAVWLSLDQLTAPLLSMALQALLEGSERILLPGLDRETSVDDSEMNPAFSRLWQGSGNWFEIPKFHVLPEGEHTSETHSGSFVQEK